MVPHRLHLLIPSDLHLCQQKRSRSLRQHYYSFKLELLRAEIGLRRVRLYGSRLALLP